MTNQSNFKFKACQNHLIYLFEAIKAGDVRSINKIEHELTPVEECVACAYALKAKGEAREVLYDFLRNEGFTVARSRNITGSEFNYWLVRLSILSVIFGAVLFLALLLRLVLFGQQIELNLSSFGWFGTFILSISIFTLLEYWFYPD